MSAKYSPHESIIVRMAKAELFFGLNFAVDVFVVVVVADVFVVVVVADVDVFMLVKVSAASTVNNNRLSNLLKRSSVKGTALAVNGFLIL